MNFSILIFKPFKPKRWSSLAFITAVFTIFCIFTFNFIIDPYNMTQYNLLRIQHKFARDDRTEKVNFFKTLPKFDNIMIGSSRVYSINPKTVSEILGGTTYNFGVGTATVEDHLGILLYLKRHNKLPKNLIIGVDFYTFNPNTPPNSYFLSNKDLNFLSHDNSESEYWAKFLSLDATRASYKTFKNHISKSNKKPRFNSEGWGRYGEVLRQKNGEEERLRVHKEIDRIREPMYSNFDYRHIDPKKIQYYEQIRTLCRENGITLYLFTTPLHPLLFQQLKKHPNTNNAMQEFIHYLSTFDHFTNTYAMKEFTEDEANFSGATHTTPEAGSRLLKDFLKKP